MDLVSATIVATVVTALLATVRYKMKIKAEENSEKRKIDAIEKSLERGDHRGAMIMALIFGATAATQPTTPADISGSTLDESVMPSSPRSPSPHIGADPATQDVLQDGIAAAGQDRRPVEPGTNPSTEGLPPADA